MIAVCDTSILIPAVVPEHSHHEPSRLFFQKITSKSIKGVLCLHSLAEFYSVLTRSPFEIPVDPALALRMIRENLIRHFTLAAVVEKDYQAALERVVTSSLRGGAVHDSLILQVALKKKIPLVVTWNKKHFERLSHGDVCIESPDAFS